MGRLRVPAALLAGCMLLSGCAGDRGDAAGDGTARLHGDAAAVDAELVHEVDEEAIGELAASVNTFGFDLHRALSHEGANVVTSPLSVATLLAMVAAGAGGETAAQMADVLGVEDVRDERFGALLRQVSDSDDVTLSVANALWADPGAPFEDDYLDHVRRVFGATVEVAPLDEQSTADAIDAWVQERTQGLIDGVADDLGLPGPNSVLVLANAVYFLGEWTYQFDPSATTDGGFTLGDGRLVQVPMMHREANPDAPVEAATRDGYRVMRLTYGDDRRYGMEVFLPDEDRDLAGLLEQLSDDEWRAAVADLEATRLHVALPRFELTWDALLNDALVALGLELPFSTAADFRPMSPADPVLGEVAHKTYIRVDEEGTEAAAVTAAEMPVSEPPSFLVERPFVFTITDSRTGTILFIGTVHDPRGAPSS